MARGEIVGLIIQPIQSNQWWLSKLLFGENVFFTIRVGMYNEKERQEMFVTTPALRDFIYEKKTEKGEVVGSIEYILEKSRKNIRTYRVFPFAHRAELKRRGVGSLIELQIEKYLEKKYPGFTIESTAERQGNRVRQMNSRGIKANDPIPIPRARQLTHAQVLGNFQKNKARNIALHQQERRRVA